jgi:hypothetical protein
VSLKGTFLGSLNALRSNPFMFTSRASIWAQIDCLTPCDDTMLTYPELTWESGSSHKAVISNNRALVMMPEKVCPIYGWDGGGHKPFTEALFNKEPRISPSHAVFFLTRLTGQNVRQCCMGP